MGVGMEYRGVGMEYRGVGMEYRGVGMEYRGVGMEYTFESNTCDDKCVFILFRAFQRLMVIRYLHLSFTIMPRVKCNCILH
jgi:hypothetical protein